MIGFPLLIGFKLVLLVVLLLAAFADVRVRAVLVAAAGVDVLGKGAGAFLYARVGRWTLEAGNAVAVAVLVVTVPNDPAPWLLTYLAPAAFWFWKVHERSKTARQLGLDLGHVGILVSFLDDAERTLEGLGPKLRATFGRRK